MNSSMERNNQNALSLFVTNAEETRSKQRERTDFVMPSIIEGGSTDGSGSGS